MLRNSINGMDVITKKGFKVILFFFKKKSLAKYIIKAVYPKGIKKKRIVPHQKKELTFQICEMFIMNVSLKNARHSETIEKRMIGAASKKFFFVESRQMQLIQIV